MSTAPLFRRGLSEDVRSEKPYRAIQPITRGLPPDIEPSPIWYIRPFLGYSDAALREYGDVLDASGDAITAGQYRLFMENLIGACDRVTQVEAECWRALNAKNERISNEIELLQQVLASREDEVGRLEIAAEMVSEVGLRFNADAPSLDATGHRDLDRAALCAELNIPVPDENPSWLWTKGTRLLSTTVIGALYGILLGQLLAVSELWQVIASMLVGSTLMLFTTVIGLPARHFGFARAVAGHAISAQPRKGLGSGVFLGTCFVAFAAIEASVGQFGFLRVLSEESSTQSYIPPGGAFLAIAFAITIPTLVATAVGNFFEGVRLCHLGLLAKAHAKRLAEIRTSPAFSLAQKAQASLHLARTERKNLEARISRLENALSYELSASDQEWIGELERNALGASWTLEDRFLKPPIATSPPPTRPARRTCCCFRLWLFLRKLLRRRKQGNPAIYRQSASAQQPGDS